MADTDTTVPHVPADERDIVVALLKVKPPTEDIAKVKARKVTKKRKGR